jgi:putative transcriptional regulator
MKSLGFRCPEDLAKKIEEKQAATGKTKSEIILEMITGMPSMSVADRKIFPEEGVVYIVWGEKKLLYIGQTKNLRRRFLHHHRLIEFLNSDANVSWFSEEECNRLEVESSLIDLLDPELNNSEVLKKEIDKKPTSIRWKLAELMARHGIKPKDLATEMGCTRDAVSNLRQRTMPRLSGDTLNNLFRSLNALSEEAVTFNDLFEYKED